MKNRLLFFSFVFLSLFLCCGNVSAKTKVGINIDANQHFNYYYEQRESTAFYDFTRALITNTDDLYSYFGYTKSNKTESNLYAFYTSDLANAEIKKYNSANQNNHWNEDISIPNNSYYALVFVYSRNLNFPLPIINIDGDNYNITYNSFRKDTAWYSNEAYNTIIRFYDKDGKFISGNSNIYFNYNKTYTFDSYDDSSSADFTYLISSCLYCNYPVNLPDKKIIITDIIEDNTHYLIDDNENYSGWLRKLFSFGKLKYTSVVDTDLNYFKTSIIQNKFPTISIIIKSGIRSFVPNDYQKVNLGDGIDNYLFIPKNINDNTLNRKFFTSTNESIHYNLFKVGLNVYDITNNYKSPYDESKLALIGFSLPMKSYQIDIESYLNKLNSNNNDTFNINNFAVGFGLFGNSSKYSADIYYNPNAYSICEFDLDSNKSCSYVNPNTGENATLTHEQIYDILSQNNKSGASVNIYDEPSEQCKTAIQYSELYEYDDNCNIIGMKQNSGVNSILESLNSIKNFLSGFVSIITTIFSYVVLLLDSLPIEIKSVLLFGLIGGTIITLYKIIRG